MRRGFLLLLCVTIAFVSPAQDSYNGDDVMEWNEFRRLDWNDFEGERPEDAAGDAGTFVRIKAKPFMVKKKVHYDVAAYFVKSKSWSDAKVPSLLRHERLHFDIAELYARKIRKRITELQANNVNKVEQLNLAVEELLEESNQMDIDYDAETLHGGLPVKQAEWEKKVKSELDSLKKFKKKRRVVASR